jgi:hypothetical protein
MHALERLIDTSDPFVLIFEAILTVASIAAWCGIAGRLGYDSALGLVMVIPVANLLFFFYWALAESPNEKRIKELESGSPATGGRRVGTYPTVPLKCPCGEVLRVAKAEAGESVRCGSCGQLVLVPSLSVLQKMTE